VTYSQSGFEPEPEHEYEWSNCDLWLSKRGDIPIQYHRDIPANALTKEVTLKKETTGEWYVTIGLEVGDKDTKLPEKPEIDDMNPELRIASALTSASRTRTTST
jgi:hypothetical protein